MAKVEDRLKAKGHILPATPATAALPFPWVNVRGERVFVSGRGPLEADGFLAEPWGKVGAGAGRHARSAVGVAELPFSIAVEIEAELTVRP